jgi:hypothetical protein
MCIVELPPALGYMVLIADLARARRTTELDEGRVRPIPKGDQIRVDRPNLHGPSGQPARTRDSRKPVRAFGNVARCVDRLDAAP